MRPSGFQERKQESLRFKPKSGFPAWSSQALPTFRPAVSLYDPGSHGLRESQKKTCSLDLKPWKNAGEVPSHDKRGGRRLARILICLGSSSKGKRGLSKTGHVYPIHARNWVEEGDQGPKEGGWRRKSLWLEANARWSWKTVLCLLPLHMSGHQGIVWLCMILHICQLNQRCIIGDAKRETLRGLYGSPEDLGSVI